MAPQANATGPSACTRSTLSTLGTETVFWRLPPSLSLAAANEAALGAAWRVAAPFPHLILDDVVAPDELGALLLRVDEEPLSSWRAEHYAFDASAPEPKSDALRTLRDDFVAVFAAPLSRITGRVVARADMRAYAYGPGHHLLPHTDHQDAVGRALAYAYYLPSPDAPEGGELELYACELDGRDVLRASSASLIAPRANRLVVFEVSDASLHQVREVMSGVRISLAGWFYPPSPPTGPTGPVPTGRVRA
jgi:hypothetical protein